MLNLSTPRLKSGCAALAVCVLAAVVAPISASAPVQAQDTYWITEDDGYRYLYNDNPELGDSDTSNSFRWNTPPGSVSNQGYGSNGFKYTYARARPGGADTYAHWRMGSPEGRFEVQVWIPGSYATAHVQYYIFQELLSGGGRAREVWLDQEAFAVSGWQSLGEHDFFGGDTVITITDSRTRDHYDQDGRDATRLAADAIRMKETRSGTTAPQPPPPPPSTAPGPPRDVSLTLTDADSFRIDWDPPSDDGGSPITGYGVAVQHASSGDIAGWSTTGTSTSFDGVVGATYAVEIWAKNSRGSGPAQRAQITIPSTGDVPGPPRNLSLKSTGSGEVRIKWDAPASDGGSRIIRYSLNAWSPDGSTFSWSTTNTEYRFKGEVGAFYTVSVTAENRHGPSTPVRESIYIDTDTPLPTVTQDDGVPPTLDDDDVAVPPTMDEPGEQPQASRPTAPRNLRLTLIDDDSFRITWDPPSNNGGAPVTGYTLEISRPRLSSTVGPWSNTYTPRGRSFTFDGRNGASYSVKVSAKNRAGTGTSARGNLSTNRVDPPGEISWMALRSIDDDSFNVTWGTPLASGGALLSNYILTVSRPPLSTGASGWSRTYIRPPDSSRMRFDGQPGVTYTVSIRGRNKVGTGEALVKEHSTGALQRPDVRIRQEGRSWLIDDPDTIVEWDPVPGADRYHIDWRYKRIDTDELGKIYREIESGGLTDEEIESRNDEAAKLLNGKEEIPSLIEGDSRPRRNGGSEVFCKNEKLERDFRRDWESYCQSLVNSDQEEFDWYNPEYHIHSRQEHLVLEVRVRAFRGTDRFSAWSDWVFHPTARLTAGCQALDFYNNIKAISGALDAINMALTVGSVLLAVASGGSSVLGAEALKQAAKAFVVKLVKDITLEALFIKFLKKLAKDVLRDSAVAAMSFVFGCLTKDFDLEKRGVQDLGVAMIEQMQVEGLLPSKDVAKIVDNWMKLQF